MSTTYGPTVTQCRVSTCSSTYLDSSRRQVSPQPLQQFVSYLRKTLTHICRRHSTHTLLVRISNLPPTFFFIPSLECKQSLRHSSSSKGQSSSREVNITVKYSRQSVSIFFYGKKPRQVSSIGSAQWQLSSTVTSFLFNNHITTFNPHAARMTFKLLQVTLDHLHRFWCFPIVA